VSAKTSIEWTRNADGTAGKTWNPVRGCSIVSPGCHHCYAMKQAHRFSGAGKAYEGLTKQTKAGPQWTGVVRTVESALLEPLSWRKPARVFVNSMSDLFHEDVPDAFIDRVFAVMALAPRHTFQILTKRAERMHAYFTRQDSHGFQRHSNINGAIWSTLGTRLGSNIHHGGNWRCRLPLPNVWLGVSVEDQQRADERIPLLLETPAAVRFVSAEPLLGPIDFTLCGHRVAGWDEDWRYNVLSGEEWAGPRDEHAERSQHLDWVIVGGESGPGARPCALEWIESVVSQCKAAGVGCFTKQLGAYVVSEERTAPVDMMSGPESAYRNLRAPNGEVWAWRMGLRDRKGGDPTEWGADYPRQFPEARQ